jgi:single-stranded DNA-binding protein
MSSTCNITGRLYGKTKTNVERGTAPGKTPFCAFTVGVYNWRDKENDFFDCVAFGQQAETLVKYFYSKRAISVNGRLAINRYKNKDGDDVKKVQIICTNIDFPTDGEGVPTMQAVHAQQISQEAAQVHEEKNPAPPDPSDDPDGLPF